MIFDFIAILVYGVLANVAALVLSSQVGSPLATALVFASAGLTYLFQVAQLDGIKRSGLLMIGAIGALLASVFVSLWSAF
jgi:hypothetical protein